MMEWNLLSPSRLSLFVFLITSSQNEWDSAWCANQGLTSEMIQYTTWFDWHISVVFRVFSGPTIDHPGDENGWAFDRILGTVVPLRSFVNSSLSSARKQREKEMGPVHRWAIQLPTVIGEFLSLLGYKFLELDAYHGLQPIYEPLTWLAIAQVDGMVKMFHLGFVASSLSHKRISSGRTWK